MIYSKNIRGLSLGDVKKSGNISRWKAGERAMQVFGKQVLGGKLRRERVQLGGKGGRTRSIRSRKRERGRWGGRTNMSLETEGEELRGGHMAQERTGFAEPEEGGKSRAKTERQLHGRTRRCHRVKGKNKRWSRKGGSFGRRATTKISSFSAMQGEGDGLLDKKPEEMPVREKGWEGEKRCVLSAEFDVG